MKKEDTLFKYVQKIGVAHFDNEKDFYNRTLICDNGLKYRLSIKNQDTIKVGQNVFLAKPIPTLKNYPKQFEIHEVILPPSSFYFDILKNAKNEKERRMIIQKAYQDRTGHYFPSRGNKSFLVFVA
jgi:hypothetical protein